MDARGGICVRGISEEGLALIQAARMRVVVNFTNRKNLEGIADQRSRRRLVQRQ